MESGNFQEAIEILEEASITNRNDRDILEKLKEAKTKLVQRKFIEVRLARMAGNSEGALDLLTETLEKREKWGSSIKQQSGAVQVTIQEESEYARPVLRRRIEKLAESELPWPTYKERLQHRILYAELSTEWQRKIELDEKKKAISQCKALGAEKSVESPFYNRWIDQLCSPWSAPANPPSPIAQKDLNWKGTYGNVAFKQAPELQRNPLLNFLKALATKDVTPELAEVARRSFHASPWLQASSPHVLEIETYGKFSNSENRRTETRTASYSEPKTIEIRDSSGNVRRETQYENREIKYPVDVVEVRYFIEARLTSAPGGPSATLQYNQEKSQRDDTHQTSDRRAGLTPDPLNIVPASTWVGDQMEVIGKQWIRKLEESWFETYCSGQSPLELKPEENMARCFYSEIGKRKNSGSLVQFTRERYGLIPADLAKILSDR